MNDVGRAAPALLAALALAGCTWTPDPQLARTEVGKYGYIVAGQGAPAAVFEANLGNGKAVWDPVFVRISRGTRVFAYDRAGNGDSVARSNDRSAAQIAQELRDLLRAAGIPSPYVLVAHSLGGLYAEYYARTWPQEVAGVVMLDGLYRDYVLDCFPIENRADTFCPASAVMLRTFHAEPSAGVKEYQGMRATLAQLQSAGPFPPVPLTVIAGTRDLTASPEDQAWLGRQKALAGLSPQGRFIECKGCGFAVQHDDPALVVQAAEAMVKQARAAR
jgi:pimeloyl-ACP methyl ester carboxylesterase